MSSSHWLQDTVVEGFSALRLTSSDDISATYVPAAGMVCCSLTHRGEELLGQRGGIASYVSKGTTMGIPLLHPWANRLSRLGYEIKGKRVDFPADSSLLHFDPNGLPLHGLLAGCSDWKVTEQYADDGSAGIEARLDLSNRQDFLALFPFPHAITLKAELRNRSLNVTTTVKPTEDLAVPIAFGYHPFFVLPNVPRNDWKIELPVRRRMQLDEKMLPAGETEAVNPTAGRLGSRTYDDLFVELAPQPIFKLTGGGRQISVSFGENYRMAQVFAPANDDVICFEPMTAPIDPFDSGAFIWAQPGSTFTATFEILVEETDL